MNYRLSLQFQASNLSQASSSYAPFVMANKKGTSARCWLPKGSIPTCEAVCDFLLSHHGYYFGPLTSLESCEPGFELCTVAQEPLWVGGVSLEKARQRCRSQKKRAEKNNLSFQVVSHAEAIGSSFWQELRAVRRQWLQQKKLPPLGFLAFPRLFSYDIDYLILAVQDRAIVGCATIIELEGQVFLESIFQSKRIQGLGEGLVAEAFSLALHNESSSLTMGMVPLAGDAVTNPLWFRWARQLSLQFGETYYGFRGLYDYRLKFFPSFWEPLYFLSPKRLSKLNFIRFLSLFTKPSP